MEPESTFEVLIKIYNKNRVSFILLMSVSNYTS